jgi:hypothetical protein
MLVGVAITPKVIKVDPLACPGPCNRGRDPEQRHDHGMPVWCQACQRRIRAALTEVDRLCTWVESQADGFPSRTGGDGRSGRSGGGSAASPATDLIDTVYSELVLIELEWRRTAGLAGSARNGNGRTAYNRAQVVAFLQSHLSHIMNHPKMIKPLARVLALQTVLQRFAHSEPSRKDKPGRCPKCHNVSVLFWDSDDELIHCRFCMAVITEAVYALDVAENPDAAVVTESRRVLGLAE